MQGATRGRRATAPVTIALVAVAALLSAAPATAGELRRGAIAESERSVERYWSEERMRSSRPLERVVGLERAGAGAEAPGRGGAPLTVEPTAPFDSGRDASAASYPVPEWRAFPQSTHGKLYGRSKRWGPFHCSATVVSAANRATIATAAHCVKDPWGPWVRKLMFVPSFHHGAKPFGRWVWRGAWVDRRWAKRTNPNFDFAAVALKRRGGRLIEEVTGARGIRFGGPAHQGYRAFGYPANKQRGKRLWGCDSKLRLRDPRYRPPGPRPLGIRCDMKAGSSGGGWIVDDDYIASVTSFRYPRKPWLYGPYLGAAAKRVYQRAARSRPGG